MSVRVYGYARPVQWKDISEVHGLARITSPRDGLLMSMYMIAYRVVKRMSACMQ